MPQFHLKALLEIVANMPRFVGLLCILCGCILLLCVIAAFSGLKHRIDFGYLLTANLKRIKLVEENSVGYKRECDIKLPHSDISSGRVATLKFSGDMLMYHSNGIPLTVNGKKYAKPIPVKDGDTLAFNGTTYTYSIKSKAHRDNHKLSVIHIVIILMISACYVIAGVAIQASYPEISDLNITVSIAAVILALWTYLFISTAFSDGPCPACEAAVTICLFSVFIVCAYLPDALIGHSISICAGIIICMIVERITGTEISAGVVRITASILGLILLALNVISSKSILGARNWLSLGGVTFQPSELIKDAVIILGGCSAIAVNRKVSTWSFMLYSAVCVLAMAYISDFGTAAVFFAIYLVIIWLRRGFGIVMLSVAAAGGGICLVGVLSGEAFDYVIKRITSCGTAWDNIQSTGYQQTRAMMAAASGGCVGVGLGRGKFGEIFASGSDLPVALLWEECGLVSVVIVLALCIFILAYAVICAVRRENAFYSISACGTCVMLFSQIVLNLLGTFDIIPFTGVTFPFLSTGGTSMISCWIAMAFINTCHSTSGYKRRDRTAVNEEY